MQVVSDKLVYSFEEFSDAEVLRKKSKSNLSSKKKTYIRVKRIMVYERANLQQFQKLHSDHPNHCT